MSLKEYLVDRFIYVGLWTLACAILTVASIIVVKTLEGASAIILIATMVLLMGFMWFRQDDLP